jgi:hypothetical protein
MVKIHQISHAMMKIHLQRAITSLVPNFARLS